MNSSPSVSSSTSRHSESSSEDEKTNSAYQAASDPARQAAYAAPSTADVPFMYNNNHVSSGTENGSAVTASGTAGAGQVTYGGANTGQPVSAPMGTSLSYAQYAPSRSEVRARAEGRQGAIGFGDPQSPPTSTRVDLNQPFNDGNVKISYASGYSPDSQQLHESLSIETGDGSDSVHIDRGRDGGLLAQVNGKSYEIPFQESAKTQQNIRIDTAGGADDISIGAGENRNVTIGSGAGNDIVL